MHGEFYGIGVGPGDPGLLTIKAIKAIQEADVIIAPKTEKKGESIALAIARPYLKEKVEIVTLLFPMVFCRMSLNEAWENNKKVLEGLLASGKKVAFLTLGDPMLYSTYIYLYRLLEGSGYPRTTIPGVPSFCAAAARCGRPLAEGDEILSIIPATVTEERLQEITRLSDNTVFLKASSRFIKNITHLSEMGLLEDPVLVSRCGMPGEEIYWGSEAWERSEVPYFSTILAKGRGKQDGTK